ncbi:MAG: pseudouridylate synthase [Deltaproteobacteria bacterium]|nr:pseudouridylate synthase [Deltaproteobacteria bacterium]
MRTDAHADHETPVLLLARHDDLCFVDKPSGLLVHNSAWAGPRERTLVDDVNEALGAGWHPLHRLDRQTSGVVAFARTEHAARLQAALAAACRRYWALVRGHLRAAVEVDHPIVDEEAGVRVAREAKSVVTPLVLSTVERCSLVEVRLLTGRRHQARRHLKHLSHPVLGDATHGKGPLNREYRARYGLARLALHARSLVLDGRAATSPLPAELRVVFQRLFPSSPELLA